MIPVVASRQCRALSGLAVVLGAAFCLSACRDLRLPYGVDASFEPPDASIEDPDAGEDGGTDAGDDGGTDAGPMALRVLFIGNSYTYVNDLPRMLERIAATAGTSPSISTEQVVVGGATLTDHWTRGVAQTLINERQWTHVVLQGQSFEPLGQEANFVTAATQFGDLIVDAGARPTLFVTWAKAAGDPLFEPETGPFISPAHMQDRLTIAYRDLGRQWPQTLLSCVGPAFRDALEQHPELVLHQEDLSHATVAGTYLAACTFYVALTGKPVPPTSEVPAGVSAHQAALLREVARVGSSCADVRIKAIVELENRGSRNVDGGPPFEFGTAGIPIPTTLYLTNKGDTAAGIADGKTLAPPFSWTAGGAYPGGTGTVERGGLTYSFCSSALAAGGTCALAVSFSGAGSGVGSLTLELTDAYTNRVALALRGSATGRALLTVSETPGFFGCTDATCAFSNLLWTAPGVTLPFTHIVTNRGGAPTSALGVGTPLAPPFYWAGDGGTFPGGSGQGMFRGQPYDFCTTATLGPGQQCMVTASFVPGLPDEDFQSAINLAYSDALGPVSPNANRNVHAFTLGESDGGGISSTEF
jgi:hypothetical protein